MPNTRERSLNSGEQGEPQPSASPSPKPKKGVSPGEIIVTTPDPGTGTEPPPHHIGDAIVERAPFLHEAMPETPVKDLPEIGQILAEFQRNQPPLFPTLTSRIRGGESPQPRSSALQDLYEEVAHAEKVRTTYRRRLHILEEQVAHHGLHAAPAHMLLEIEDTEEAIRKFNRCLKDLEADIARHEAIAMTIKISFPGDFTQARLTGAQKDMFCLIIAQIVGCKPADILLEGIEAGSIVFKLNVPERAAARLVALKKVNHALLSTIIEGVAPLDIVVDESENDDVFQALVQREYQRLTEPAHLTDEAAEALHTDLQVLLAADDAKSTRAAIERLYQRMVETGVIQDGATDTELTT